MTRLCVDYDVLTLQVVGDELGENELHFDGCLGKEALTILVSTEISAINHSGQLTLPQN